MRWRLGDWAWGALFAVVQIAPLVIGFGMSVWLGPIYGWVVVLVGIPVAVWLLVTGFSPHSQFIARLFAGLAIIGGVYLPFALTLRQALGQLFVTLCAWVAVRGAWWDREARIVREAEAKGIIIPANPDLWTRFKWVWRGRIERPRWLERRVG